MIGTKEFHLLFAWEAIPGDPTPRVWPCWRCFRLDPCTRKQRICNRAAAVSALHTCTRKVIIRWRDELAITRMQIKMLVCFACVFWLNGQKNTGHKWNMVTYRWRQKFTYNLSPLSHKVADGCSTKHAFCKRCSTVRLNLRSFQFVVDLFSDCTEDSYLTWSNSKLVLRPLVFEHMSDTVRYEIKTVHCVTFVFDCPWWPWK